jgi:hypothetical protein
MESRFSSLSTTVDSAFIRRAVEASDLAALRAALYQASGDPALAAFGPVARLRPEDRARLVSKAVHVVWCQNSADRLSGPPFVVVEDPTQPFMADDGGIHVDHARRFLDQLIIEPLMIPLSVIMLRVLLHSVAEMVLAQWDDLGQALGLD